MSKTRIEVKRLGINGEGIGFWQQKPVFIDGALTNETVLVDNIKSYGKYAKAHLIKVEKASKYRCAPNCKLYGQCGGCNLMHAKYTHQLKAKENYLKESLTKYAPKVNVESFLPIIGSKKNNGYRNHAKLILKKYSGHWHTGLYESGSNHFLTIDQYCLIHDPIINQTIKQLLNCLDNTSYQNFDSKTKLGLRGVAIRYLSGQLSITLVTGKDELSHEFVAQLQQTTKANVIAQIINTSKNVTNLMDGNIRYLTKNHHLNVNVCNLNVSIAPQAFFQLNTHGLEAMVETIDKLLPNNVSLFEGYCGVGLLSLALAKKINYGVGVEIVDAAIVSANKNASNNGIKQMQYKVGDSANELRYEHKKHKFDVVLVDPPRSGLDDNMIKTLLKTNVDSIIYVSCNPSTLAKNLDALKSKYQVKLIQPLDMFPQTMHVESITLLQRR